MEYAHPHKAGKILGVIHEDAPRLHPIDLVRTGSPVTRPAQYLLDPNGPFFSLFALMQSYTSECGGFSLAQFINLISVMKKAQASAQLSGSFDYAYEKTVDGCPGQDGTTITALGLAGERVGSCLDSLFPDDGALTTSPQNIVTSTWPEATPQAIADAAARILGTPFQLTDLSIDGIHQACFENTAVILEVQIGDEWYTAADGNESWQANDVLPIRPPKTVIDAHYILVAPYDEPNDLTYFINSWSKKWGHNGFGYFNSNYAPFIKGGIAFKQIPQSVTQVLNNATIEAPQKQALIQQILADIERAIGLIGQEI